MTSIANLSIPLALAISAASFVVYYAASAIYCIFFHPLSKYPGPFIAKFSQLPSFYHTYRGNRHVWLWQCHEIYGHVVRSSYDTLMFSDPDTYREIYGSRANVQKAWQFGIWPKDATAVSTFACTDKNVHKRRRRNLDYAFCDRAVRSAELFVAQHTDRWGPLLAQGAGDGDGDGDGWSEARNMTESANNFVFDILCDLCFGRTYETKSPGPNKLRTVPDDVAQYMKFTYTIFYSPLISIWLFFKPRGLDKLLIQLAPSAVRMFMDFVVQNLRERLEQAKADEKSGTTQAGREDMLSYLINAKDAETGKPAYNQVELNEEANMLTAAGADTTSAVIAALFFYLVHDAHVLEKLTTEIRTTFSSIDEIKTGKPLLSCLYLQASIEETLRMNPHGGSESRRQVLPGGLCINQHVIPADTIIGGDVYTMHHNADIFPEPFQFRPERWIEGNGVSAEDVKACEGSVFAFSYGNRSCPGKGLARMELAITMARLIYRYDFRGLPGGTEGQGRSDMMWGRRQKTQFQVWDFMVAHRNGPMVQFRNRTS
ncbi:benzoate 4-monooxygenase cytochrome P450 [Pleomassaria siparia CBS 279.74]|uniref:Benzoate 4-monooxygenase cytochrome P450 n=1 Tax=Pleomassaria siparia CBS 279.74 TaxID=1314801 RepID=A0A6G1JVK6_9PLEO|nr:benzoate 4-monooxygenase cytochrome P450 [Pleomassaria siparia CBS 279.74]